MLTSYGGCVVDCSGNVAAVANAVSGQVAVYDISSPSAPVKKEEVSTSLSAISALSIDGSKILAGDRNFGRVAMIDVSNPASPVVRSVLTASSLLVSSVVHALTRMMRSPVTKTRDIAAQQDRAFCRRRSPKSLPQQSVHWIFLSLHNRLHDLPGFMEIRTSRLFSTSHSLDTHTLRR